MTADTRQKQQRMRPTTPAKPRAKARLRTLADLDKRTRAHRDTSELMESIAADLGGWRNVSTMKREVITAASLLGAVIRDRAASYLAGDAMDLGEFITLTNAQRRLLADLGLERRARDTTPDLHDYLSRQTESDQ
jgi:hypothetical protein